MRLNRIAFFTTLLSILCLGASFKVWADDEVETYGKPESHDFIKNRTYIGIYGTSVNIDNNNDFSGYEAYASVPVTTTSSSATVIGNYEVNYIPTINRSFGFAGMAGHREGPWAAEISYWYSNHTANILSTDSSGNPVTAFGTTGTYTTINLDLKRYFFTSVPLQPFLDLGLNFAYLTSHNTSNVLNPNFTPNSVVAIGDSTESGIGLNLGVGAELYLGDGLSLVGGVIQRWTGFNQINGQENLPSTPTTTGATNANGNLQGNGVNFYVGTTLGFDE